MNRIGVYTHVRKETHRMLKVANQTLWPPIVSALLFLAIFHFVVGERSGAADINYLLFLVPGLVMMAVINSSFANSSSSLFIAKWVHTIEHLLTMPLSYFELCLGYVIGSIIRSFMVGVGIIIATSFFVGFHMHNVFIVLLYFIITGMLFGSLGVLVALWADHFEHLGIFSTFLLTPLTMLGGVFYSITVLPLVFQKITLFNPIFYLVDGFRYGMLGVHDASLWLGILVTSSLSVLFFWFVVFLMKKGYKVKQ